jgi:hypothetical protein
MRPRMKPRTKPVITKQGALKAVLLFALVANISWGPAQRALSQLSSSSSETVSNGPIAAPTTAAALAAAPAPTANSSDTSDNSDEISGDVSPNTETPKICGERVYITYREYFVVKNGKKDIYTEISVKPHAGESSSIKAFKITPAGGLKTNLEDKEVKKDNDEKIAKTIRRQVSRCQEDAPPPVIVAPEEPISKGDKEALKRAVKECRLTAKGDALTEVQKTRCRLKQLGEIDSDGDRSGNAKAAHALEVLVKGDLRKAIKNRLMSTDETKVSEGEELLSEVIDQVKDTAADLTLDPYKTAKLVGELESLRAGGETYRRSADLATEMKDAKAELRSEMLDAQQNCRAQGDMVARQCMLEVQRNVMMKQQQLQTQLQMDVRNGPYSQLTAAQRMGYVSLSEFNQFTQPYEQLRRDLVSMLDPRTLTLGSGSFDPSLGPLNGTNGLPADFSSYRYGLASSMQKNYGVGIPQRPANMTAMYGMNTNNTYSPYPNSGAPISTFNSLYGAPNQQYGFQQNQFAVPNNQLNNQLNTQFSNIGGRRWQ